MNSWESRLVIGISLGRELSESHKLYRSEEHTSELQSHLNLVCRLLLEKKKSTARDSWTRDYSSVRSSSARMCAGASSAATTTETGTRATTSSRSIRSLSRWSQRSRHD